MSEKMKPQPDENDIPTVESNFQSKLDSKYYDYTKAAKLAEEAGLDEPAEELRAKAGKDIIRKQYPEVSPFEHSNRAANIRDNVESEYYNLTNIDHAETPEAAEHKRRVALEIAGFPQFIEGDKESIVNRVERFSGIYVKDREALDFLTDCLDSVPYSYGEFTDRDVECLCKIASIAADALSGILEEEKKLPDKKQFTKEYFPLFDPQWRSE